MQQTVSNETSQSTPAARSASNPMSAFATRIRSLILHHTKRIHPAAAVIVIFLAVTFTLTVGSSLMAQTLATATLPVAGQTQAQPDTAHVAAKPDSAAEAPRYIAGLELKRMTPLPPEKVDNETLWLARVIYSETKRPEEQELVAWVVRNRVETEYRGKDTYEEVVNDPYQFSAFIPGTPTRKTYTNLTSKSQTPGFQKALAIANQVRNAPDSLRPFSETTRHFFSQQSMVGGRTPNWAHGKRPVTPTRDFTVESKRFRFYQNIG